MKTNLKNVNTNIPRTLRPRSEQERLADIDLCIRDAARGDEGALSILAVLVRPALVEEARAHLGGWDDEAEDVVDELLASMCEGEHPFVPREGRGLAWMLGVLRAIARRRRGDRRRDWAIDDEDGT